MILQSLSYRPALWISARDWLGLRYLASALDLSCALYLALVLAFVYANKPIMFALPSLQRNYQRTDLLKIRLI